MSLAGLKSQGVRPAFLLEGSRQNFVPCLFQLLETAHIPWLGVSFHLPEAVTSL